MDSVFEALVRIEMCIRDRRAVERAKTPNGYSRTELAALPTAILVRALERILRRAGGAQPEAIHLEQAAAMVRAGRGSLSAPGGIQLAVQGNTLFVAQKPLPPWSLPVTCLLYTSRCV